MFSVLADFVVVLHLAFVAFVVAGGFLALRWRWLVWVHLPAAVWGALIEFFGWICPLTPLENDLRRRAGEATYGGGFVETYLLPILYPGALTRTVQLALGTLVVVINVLAYGMVLRRTRS